MPVLEKARLQMISTTTDAEGSPEILESDTVQFNPTTLKIKITNEVEGGQSSGRQTRQHVGSSSAVLTLELHFDTADEGTTERPVSVRDRTKFLERFVRPGEGLNQPPPRARFHWGNLIFDGVIESVDLDLEHFAASGVPLRAKASLSIKEQDPQYQFEKPREAEQEGGGAPEAGDVSGAAPGTTAAGSGDRSAAALAGETAVDFAARVGLDPAAWRGLSVDLGLDLELSAGVEVGFSAGLSSSVGLGVNVGMQAGMGASLEASFGLEADASVSAGASASAGGSASADRAAGFALSAAGGVGPAIESVQIAKSKEAESAARENFDAPAAPASTGAVLDPTAASAGVGIRPTGPPDQARSPLRAGTGSAPTPAPPPPRADPRSAGFGLGVPLRPRVTGAAEERKGYVVVGGSSASATGRDPTAPSWTKPAAPADAPSKAPTATRKRCGCRAPCRHAGGRS